MLSFMPLTIDFVDALHFWLVVKVFPQKAATNEHPEQSEKNDEKVVIFEQTGRFFLALLLRHRLG